MHRKMSERTEFPISTQTLDIAARRKKAAVQTRGEDELVTLRGGNHCLGFGCGRGQRFFTKHMPAALEGGECLRGMKTGWRSDDGQGAGGRSGLLERRGLPGFGKRTRNRIPCRHRWI